MGGRGVVDGWLMGERNLIGARCIFVDFEATRDIRLHKSSTWLAGRAHYL